MPQTKSTETKLTAGKVAKIVDEYTIVINKGARDGVKSGQRFLFYNYSEEVLDPDTKDSLGKLEVVRGTGRVTHLQETMATVGSDMTTSPGRSTRRVRRTSMGMVAGLFGPEEVEETLPAQAIPFEGAKVGDLAKPV